MATVQTRVDVCVIGGGMAGVCAALAAARSGAKVALVQDRPMLGGNASSEIRVAISGADHWKPIWRETGILEELRIQSLAWRQKPCPSRLDLALYDACRSEPNLQLFLNCRMTDCRADGKHVVSCEAREVTSNRIIHVDADYFIDSSGDGALAFAAGAEFMMGREARSRFGESLAPEKADSYTLGHTILFETTNVGRREPFYPPPWALKFESDKDLPLRPHKLPNGYYWIEWGGTKDTIGDSEAIKDELLAAALGLWDHMKNKGAHGFANRSLSWIGFIPGRRESRRFVGEAIMTQADVQSGRQWSDQIAFGGWPIDLHPPLGFRSPEMPANHTHLERPYGIPLRACYCKGFDNLFMAGRNVSASHVAFGSLRVMATCAAMGQGVGTAAAVAAKHGLTAECVDRYVGEVQQILLRDGAYLLDVRNQDPTDLARSASVSASSSMEPKFAPARVIDGLNHPDNADWHCWRSDPVKGFPAWIELRWPNPVEVGQVQLVLDTDFESLLTLVRKSPVPRPPTIKDLDIEIEQDGTWRKAGEVRGNYHRLVRVGFPRGKTSAVRIRALSTWGADYASVFEVRCGR